MGNFEEGTKKVKEITKIPGQTYYKLDEEKIPYTRADAHLIEKAKEKDKVKETVSPAVNEARNANVSENERTEDELSIWWVDFHKKISPEEEKKRKGRDEILERVCEEDEQGSSG